MKPICDTFWGKFQPACIIQKKQVKKGNLPSFAQPQQTPGGMPGGIPGGMPGGMPGTDTGNLFKNPILLTVGGLAAIGILVYVLRKK